MLQKSGYIYRYPHQLGLMLYDCILMLFRADPALNFVMNFVFVIGINHLSCKILDALFHDKAVNLLTIVCTFAFLPTVSTYGQYILGKPANGLGNRAIYQPAAS